MVINRPFYLEKLIKRRNNGMAKVVTGIRRCGKSYLLNVLYRDWLYSQGVDREHVVNVELDDIRNAHLRDARALFDFIDGCIVDRQIYYVFLDEIQFVEDFSEVVNGLMHLENVDVYVTGSNSRFLSSDILTEFRGRGDEIRVRPLAFSEYHGALDNAIEADWRDYVTFGGMPQVASMRDSELKAEYLTNLYRKVYLTDICDRNGIRHSQILEALVEVLSSSIGSLVSFKKIADTFTSRTGENATDKTIKRQIDFLVDAFLFEQAKRFDLKGRKYIGGNSKYYAEDVGLRNAILSFRQQEENHIMENIVFLELKTRGYSVDVGQVAVNEKADGKWVRKNCEVDFVASKGSEKKYIQCAFAMPDDKKRAQEARSLNGIGDAYEKVIIVREDINPWYDESGVLTIGIFDFLLKS